jgi:cell division protein FtsI (penicillin-binding protein 3)
VSVPARSTPPPLLRRPTPPLSGRPRRPATTVVPRAGVDAPARGTARRRTRRFHPAFWVLTAVTITSIVVALVSVSAFVVETGFGIDRTEARIADLLDEGERLGTGAGRELGEGSRPGDARRGHRAAGAFAPRGRDRRSGRLRRTPAHRLVILLAIMVFSLVGVVARLGVLQVRQAGAYVELGWDQRMRTVSIAADRGEIVDRNGAPLALSLEARDVYADPRYVTDPAGEAATIARIIDLARPDARGLRATLRAEGSFVYVARRVDLEVADVLAAESLPGIGFLPSSKRYYPAGGLASQLLGFTDVDGLGIAGLEKQYESVLAGTMGERTSELSPLGQVIAGGLDVVEPPIPGEDLVLTIDREIQFQAQQHLRQAVEENRAAGGTIVVMDPRTGDVYAMASYPWFDPNRVGEFDPTTYRNRAVTDLWEPGSVNKVITAAAALETGEVGLADVFAVPATRDIDGYTIHDSHPHAITRMTLADIIAESSNIGSSLVADRVGSEGMAAYFSRFGFGEATGIGFPGEQGGLMPDVSQWTDVTRATVSFGSGVAVTPMQMASVYATVANGGEWVQPRLVTGTRTADGSVQAVATSPTRRVIDPSTADALTRMLAYVVADGTGANARIPGYQVAGKTGTAKKLEDGKYVQRYVASFIGFLPASEPRIVVAAILDEPATVYGGVAAAPLFQDVARYAIQRLGIETAPAVPLPRHALLLP